MFWKSKPSLDTSLAAAPGLWFGVVLVALCSCAWLSSDWERRNAMSSGDVTGLVQLYAVPSVETRQETSAAADGTGLPFQHITRQDGLISAEYGYLNFNTDQLRTRFLIPARELQVYQQSYGYQQSDLDGLRDWQLQKESAALQLARQQGLDQQELNRRVEEIDAEYLARYRALLVSRGFRILSEKRFAPDIPAVVRQNVAELREVAQSLSRAAKTLNYDASETVGAALSLVQTALRYENVPARINGRITAGIYPPLEAMALGKGDCDSKTALLASILLNWDQVQLVGVGVPDHYLMGILQSPGKGDLYIEYQGLPYVLIEPAGPAWLPPGTIAAYTQQLLDVGENVTIDPLVASQPELN